LMQLCFSIELQYSFVRYIFQIFDQHLLHTCDVNPIAIKKLVTDPLPLLDFSLVQIDVFCQSKLPNQ
jgi:hypothetical protein